MAFCPKSIIADILKAREDKGGIVNVYYVACGGSYAGLHPGKYFLQSDCLLYTSGITGCKGSVGGKASWM